MRSLFADTFHWVALLNPGDAFQARVTSFGSTLGLAHVVTADEAVTEQQVLGVATGSRSKRWPQRWQDRG